MILTPTYYVKYIYKIEFNNDNKLSLEQSSRAEHAASDFARINFLNSAEQALEPAISFLYGNTQIFGVVFC